MGKKIFYVVIVLVLGGAAVAYWIWNKPHRDVTNEKGLEITAVDLFKAFDSNDSTAYSKYLNKAIQVTGEVSGITKTDENSSSVTLKVDGSGINSVQCSLKELKTEIKAGMTITVKGICTGFTGDLGFKDVKLSECVLVKAK